jgi:hypothetical protein
MVLWEYKPQEKKWLRIWRCSAQRRVFNFGFG